MDLFLEAEWVENLGRKASGQQGGALRTLLTHQRGQESFSGALESRQRPQGHRG